MPDDQQQGQQQGQQQQSQSQGQQQGQQQSQAQGDKGQQQQQSQQQGQSQQQSQQQTDWRKDIAGENADWLKTLERFASPKAMFESYQSLRSKMASGELRDMRPFPEKGTPEEQAAWRRDRGLPEKHDGYDLKFEDGLVIGEADKPVIEGFLKVAHARNYSPEQVKDAVKWYYDQQDAAADAREKADAETARKTQDTLRAEWQGEYRTNMNGMHALLDTLPKGVKEKLMNARQADGNPVMSDPDVLRGLVGLFRQINPVTTIGIAGDDAAVAKGIDGELDQIRSVMKTDRKKYNADPKMQARYRELIAAKERFSKKAA